MWKRTAFIIATTAGLLASSGIHAQTADGPWCMSMESHNKFIAESYERKFLDVGDELLSNEDAPEIPNEIVMYRSLGDGHIAIWKYDYIRSEYCLVLKYQPNKFRSQLQATKSLVPNAAKYKASRNIPR